MIALCNLSDCDLKCQMMHVDKICIDKTQYMHIYKSTFLQANETIRGGGTAITLSYDGQLKPPMQALFVLLEFTPECGLIYPQGFGNHLTVTIIMVHYLFDIALLQLSQSWEIVIQYIFSRFGIWQIPNTQF